MELVATSPAIPGRERRAPPPRPSAVAARPRRSRFRLAGLTFTLNYPSPDQPDVLRVGVAAGRRGVVEGERDADQGGGTIAQRNVWEPSVTRAPVVDLADDLAAVGEKEHLAVHAWPAVARRCPFDHRVVPFAARNHVCRKADGLQRVGYRLLVLQRVAGVEPEGVVSPDAGKPAPAGPYSTHRRVTSPERQALDADDCLGHAFPPR